MKRIVCLFAIFFCFLSVSPAQDIADVEGYWSWAFSPHLGMTEGGKTFFYVFRKDGQWQGLSYGYKDGKKRALNHLRIKSVRIEDGAFVLVLPWANHYYKGTLSSDGKRLEGFLRHHSQKDDLMLTKVPNPFQ